MVKYLVVLVCLVSLPVIALARDGGRWVRIGRHNDAPVATKIIAGPGSKIFFVAADGIYLSKDGGGNWDQMMNLPGAQKARSYLISPAGSLLVRTDTALYISLDGSTWEMLPNPSPLFRLSDLTSMTFDNQEALYFCVDYRGIFRLASDASNYTQLLSTFWMHDIWDMRFDASGRVYLLGSDSVFRYTKSFQFEKRWRVTGSSKTLLRAGSQIIVAGDSVWSNFDAGPTAFESLRGDAIAVDSAGELISYGYNSFQRSSDLGKTWENAGWQLPISSSSPLEATNRGFISEGAKGSTLISLDTGKTFTELQAFNEFLTFRFISVDRHGTIHAWDSLNGHWTSNNGGHYWSLEKLPSSYLSYGSGIVHISEDDKLYIKGSQNGPLESTDHGATFHTLPHPTVTGATKYYVDAVTPGKLYSFADNGVASRSTDGGASWTDFSTIKKSYPNQTDPTSMSSFAEDGADIWATGNGGTYHTTNDGKLWTGVAYSGPDMWIGRGHLTFITEYGGYQWLGRFEQPSYSTFFQCPGPIVQVDDSTVIGAIPFVSYPYHVDALVRGHRYLTQPPDTLMHGPDVYNVYYDTLLRGEDSLEIRAMALDSSGNLYGVGHPSPNASYGTQGLRGIYKWYPAGASVKEITQAATKLEISAEHGTLSVASPTPFTEITVSDILGRAVYHASFSSREECLVPLASGTYFLMVRSGTSQSVAKIVMP